MEKALVHQGTSMEAVIRNIYIEILKSETRIGDQETSGCAMAVKK
jgi:hypothetical protein